MDREKALSEIEQTTISLPQWKHNVATGKYNPKDGSSTHWGQFFEAMQPDSTVGTGLGLYQLGDTLGKQSHLYDGTYDLVIGNWDDAFTLWRLGEGFVYTVVAGTPGADPVEYTVLDPNNPQAYISAVKAHWSNYGFGGVFLDNTLSTIPGLTSALKAVSDAIRPSIKFMGNVGSYVAGDARSDTGDLWISWEKQIDLYFDKVMLENWQQFSGGALLGQPRTDANGGNWGLWQRCANAPVSAQFVGCTYGPPDSNSIYGRASMLKSNPNGIFIYHSEDSGDSYRSGWTKSDPNPVVNADGTASI